MGAEPVSGAEGRTPMLSREENERLTRVGPGTPIGTLLRRYWFPIAATADLDANPVKAIKLLGEDLVLFRDRRGRLGLIGAQRRASSTTKVAAKSACGSPPN